MFTAESPQDLIQVLQPEKNYRDFESRDEFETYIQDFYLKENIEPRIDCVLENHKAIFKKPDFIDEQYYWNLLLVYYIQNALVIGEQYKRAFEMFPKFVQSEIQSYIEDERSQTEKGFDYPSNIIFIALQIFLEYKNTSTISDSLLKLWALICPEELVKLLVFPSDSEPNQLPRNVDFHEIYVNVIGVMKEKGETGRAFQRHVLCCLKLLYDNVQYFELEGRSKYLLYVEKLKAISNETDIPSEIFDLYHFLINVQSEIGQELSFSDIDLSATQINSLVKLENKVFKWSVKTSNFTLMGDYFDLISHNEDKKNLKLVTNVYNNVLTLSLEQAKQIVGYHVSSVDFLFENKQYDILANFYLKGIIETKRIWFEIAYSLKEQGHVEQAQKVYEESIENNKGSSSVYNNLGVIFEQDKKEYEKAFEYYLKAIELSPEDKTIINNVKRIEGLIKKQKERPKILKDTYFKKLNKYQRSILIIIYKLSSQNLTVEDIVQASKQTEANVRRNLSELIKHEVIQEHSSGNFTIEPIIEKLIADYVDPKLERQIIKVDNSILYRPIFYHESEINLYKVLIELFPQHFVFPNISLKTIIDVDKLKELVSGDQMNYLFMAHVDFAIINTSTYTPVLAFEKDSAYHDNKAAINRDEWKNHIFKMSGIPLIRIRFNNNMLAETLKHQIREATKDLILETQREQTDSRLLQEIDIRKFGVTMNSTYDINVIQEIWKKVVGEGIAQKSRIEDVVEHDFIISISKELEPIIAMSHDKISLQMRNEFPKLNKILYEYY
ncbi:hypothetical protein YDYSY3_45330 [Paenibacillus chitinolyticus]|uniref:DUF2726 domain-containing protein n=1 Tax=Paenibacillus chitinolyticus TaxID=79263 RepID=UPI0026E49726|nr:DUF2726 domain-containing protein [Paenibacillus chitinolyticus]GKS13533.1 hypothetical protein YDYSY3_45330 [Paenibacillus chitinolyticus]